MCRSYLCRHVAIRIRRESLYALNPLCGTRGRIGGVGGRGAVATAEGGANKYWVCVTLVAFLSHVLSKCVFLLVATVE